MTISPFSPYFEVGLSQLPIILFVLQEKGMPVSEQTIRIADETGEIRISEDYLSNGEMDSISYFSNEAHFPLAKSIVNDKKLSIEDRLSDLFLDIDDKLLSTRKQPLIQALLNKRADLKEAIVNFLLLIIEANLKELKIQKQAIQESNLELTNDELLPQSYAKIIAHIQAFQRQGVDLQFVKNEIFSWFYYYSNLFFQIEDNSEIESGKETQALAELEAIEASLRKIKETPSILKQRPMIEHDGSISPLVKFYTNDPKETLIEALMPNYTKGSAFKRFITLAWRRHYVEPVNRFLMRYNQGLFPDKLTINDIYQFIYDVQSHLNESSEKGLLISYIKFCAKYNNETNHELGLTAISSLITETVQQQEHSITDAIAAATLQYPPLFGSSASLVAVASASSLPITIDESLEKLVKPLAFSDPIKSNISPDGEDFAKLFKKVEPSSQEHSLQPLEKSPRVLSPSPSPS